jgi:hypothetical protein
MAQPAAGRIATTPAPASGQVAFWLARWQQSAVARIAGTMDPQHQAMSG